MSCNRRIGRMAVAVVVAVGMASLAACGAPGSSQVRATSLTYVSPPTQVDAAGAAGASTESPPITVPVIQPPAVPQPSLTTQSVPDPAEFTLALAGDVHFSGRTADLLAADPQTALKEAADQLSGADITMVNLETAITTRGTPAPKEFHFRAPATALEALAAGGVDVVTMANNHAVDYGEVGLADTLDAIARSPIPVIGIGADADAAYAPLLTTINGQTLAIFAASQVSDWTLSSHTATSDSPGIANAHSSRLVDAVARAADTVDAVVVYLHWGIEFDTCPSGEQRGLVKKLAAAGATAVVGTHAHVLQGAGWRDDGVYVAYGLGNYYWWRSFGNGQDDNGVLTLTIRDGSVVDADFVPTHLDARGVPLVASGAEWTRIKAQWERDRRCANLRAAAVPF